MKRRTEENHSTERPEQAPPSEVPPSGGLTPLQQFRKLKEELKIQQAHVLKKIAAYMLELNEINSILGEPSPETQPQGEQPGFVRAAKRGRRSKGGVRMADAILQVMAKGEVMGIPQIKAGVSALGQSEFVAIPLKNLTDKGAIKNISRGKYQLKQ